MHQTFKCEKHSTMTFNPIINIWLHQSIQDDKHLIFGCIKALKDNKHLIFEHINAFIDDKQMIFECTKVFKHNKYSNMTVIQI